MSATPAPAGPRAGARGRTVCADGSYQPGALADGAEALHEPGHWSGGRV